MLLKWSHFAEALLSFWLISQAAPIALSVGLCGGMVSLACFRGLRCRLGEFDFRTFDRWSTSLVICAALCFGPRYAVMLCIAGPMVYMSLCDIVGGGPVKWLSARASRGQTTELIQFKGSFRLGALILLFTLSLATGFYVSERSPHWYVASGCALAIVLVVLFVDGEQLLGPAYAIFGFTVVYLAIGVASVRSGWPLAASTLLLGAFSLWIHLTRGISGKAGPEVGGQFGALDV